MITSLKQHTDTSLTSSNWAQSESVSRLGNLEPDRPAYTMRLLWGKRKHVKKKWKSIQQTKKATIAILRFENVYLYYWHWKTISSQRDTVTPPPLFFYKPINTSFICYWEIHYHFTEVSKYFKYDIFLPFFTLTKLKL